MLESVLCEQDEEEKKSREGKKMHKYLELNQFGKALQLELVPTYYLENRTLAIQLEDEEGPYCDLTRCLDDAPGRNRAYVDVNNMGPDIVQCLEEGGFGKATGKTFQSGYVTYPEFEFDADILKANRNEYYQQYLEWQDQLKDDEVYLSGSCMQCHKTFTFIVKRSAAQKYREYQKGGPYLIQDVFPEMTNGERGLFARGQNMCNECFKKLFHL